MSHSLNEIAALCRRAARGAGFSYGEAEDAAFAMRWLCERGLPGPDALLACLTCRSEGGCEGGDRTCPLTSGAAYLDAGQPDGRFDGLCTPVLLLPFASMMDSEIGCRADNGTGMALSTLADLSGPANVTLTATDAAFPAHPVSHTRAEVTPETLAGLKAFAHRTYAPATEASRLSGAGAGTSDND